MTPACKELGEAFLHDESYANLSIEALLYVLVKEGGIAEIQMVLDGVDNLLREEEILQLNTRLRELSR